MLDASGLIHVQEDLFLVAEDELDHLRFFEFSSSNGTFRYTGQLLDFGAQESDFEPIAYLPRQNSYYCIGSHSTDYAKMLLRFRLRDQQPVDIETLEFDPEWLVGSNVNIEALSVYHDSLFIGLRSPSFGDKAAAIIFNPASGAQLLTAFDLDQRVFRDMVCIDPDNYLILGGPERGRDYPACTALVFWWNGNLLNPEVKPLAIDLNDFRAESICACRPADGRIDILIGSDESKVNRANQFHMRHTASPDLDGLFAESVATRELKVDIGRA